MFSSITAAFINCNNFLRAVCVGEFFSVGKICINPMTKSQRIGKIVLFCFYVQTILMKYLYQSDSLYKDKGQCMSIDLQQYIFFK